MNKHILLVMKWLNDKNSVSQEELEKNKCEAWTASVASVATYAAYNAAAAYADNAGYWVDEYFDRTGESRNEYLKELEK
jgi:hypothetical protein